MQHTVLRIRTIGSVCYQGPLINAAAIAKCERHVKDAVAKGAKVLVGGGPDARGPLFFQPTVLTGCTDDMLVFREVRAHIYAAVCSGVSASASSTLGCRRSAPPAH